MGPVRRWGSALALAVVVLALAACGARPPVAGGTRPAFVQIQGREVPYRGLQAWTVASATARTATRLTVFATGSDDGGTACGPPVLRIHAEETASSIRIEVADYEDQAGPMTACPAIGYVPGPHAVTLRGPIGDRTVVDASTGTTATLLVGTDYPILRPPGSFTPSALSRQDPAGAVVQTWSDGQDAAIRLETTVPSATRDAAPYGRIMRRFEVGGAPAALYRDGAGEYGQTEVQWTPNRRQTISLHLIDGKHRRWTAEQAVALARSVTNYRAEATGRLPQPVTPGTAVAAYSSADGPVHHAPNMWKSSGVFVGVDCQGRGAVTVALRGTTSSFTCGERLTHHVVKSVGKPDETFFLDVTASSGVRWAVVLARASLDGS